MLILEIAAGVWLTMMALSAMVFIARKADELDQSPGNNSYRPTCPDCGRCIPKIELAVYVSELEGYLCPGCIWPYVRKQKGGIRHRRRHRY
jgi:hypothetical protein